MFAYYFLAFLVLFNMLLTHGYKLVNLYYNLYRKLKKPKYEVGDKVMVDMVEHEILFLTQQNPPYIYYCYPVKQNNGSICIDPYIPEYKIKPKTGLLKELE